MATQVIFNNGISFAAGKTDLLVPELVALFDQNITSAEFPEGIVSSMWYVTDNPFNPNQTYSYTYGAVELDEVDEGALTPLLTTGKGKEKGFTVKSYRNKIPVTKEMSDWLEKSGSLAGADSSVKQAFQTFARNYKALVKGGIKAKNIAATKVFTNGLNGVGTTTMNGQQLFSTAHPFLQGISIASTFRNVLGGSYGTQDDDLNATSLQHALNLHKVGLRLNNGDRTMRPTKYTLMCGYGLETTARGVLNDGSMFAGTGSNANLLNTFNFKNNTVELLAHPVIWMYDKTNTQIGLDSHWYLVNAEAAREAAALRHIVLNPGELTTWIDEDTGTRYVKFYESYAFDHYGMEAYVVGSKGTA